jgi:hypothetical protein
VEEKPQINEYTLKYDMFNSELIESEKGISTRRYGKEEKETILHEKR